MSQNLKNILIAGLVCGCLFHPLASALALLIFLTSELAHKYFTRNISDVERDSIASLKIEVAKHAAVIQKDGLAKAFQAAQGRPLL